MDKILSVLVEYVIIALMDKTLPQQAKYVHPAVMVLTLQVVEDVRHALLGKALKAAKDVQSALLDKTL